MRNVRRTLLLLLVSLVSVLTTVVFPADVPRVKGPTGDEALRRKRDHWLPRPPDSMNSCCPWGRRQLWRPRLIKRA
jgi:hypothetical protein